jgi:hypothetical protein
LDGDAREVSRFEKLPVVAAGSRCVLAFGTEQRRKQIREVGYFLGLGEQMVQNSYQTVIVYLIYYCTTC